MTELAGAILLFAGSLFFFLSALGLIRLPDIYTRAHATSVGPSMGLMLILVALLFFFPAAKTVVYVLVVIIINFITSPLAAHIIARTSWLTGLPLWKRGDRPGQGEV